jgi:hypothetical protein
VLKNTISIFLLSLCFLKIPLLAGIAHDSTSRIDFDLAFKSDIGDSVVAKVGDKIITAREFLAGYEFGPAFVKREENSKNAYLEYMIDEKLLALKGYSEKIDTAEQAKNLLRAISNDITTDQMFMDDIFNKIKIPNAKIKKGVEEEQISYQLKWIFAPDETRLRLFTSKLNRGLSFDSVFNFQLKLDSVFADSRSMQVDKFNLYWRNPQFAKAVDTLKLGEVSKPVKGPDGFYIVKLVDVWKNLIVGKAEYEKDAKNVEFMLKKEEADKISDRYVHGLMLKHNPVIQGKTFSVLRSYLGSYYLPEKKYKKWGLYKRLKQEFNKLKTQDLRGLTLVAMNSDSLSISNFIYWFKPRENYLKFNENDFNSFSASIESMIWQMVRDDLLVQLAFSKGYQDGEVIKQQIGWWEDKIVYSIVRDQIANSVGLEIENPSSLKPKNDNKQKEFKKKMQHALLKLKEKYHVVINHKILNSLIVHDADNPKALDFYIIKRGGTYPHPAFPSIDFRWQTW